MAKVKWLPEALADVERTYLFLRDKDEEAAARAAGKILEGAEILALYPPAGKPMPDETGRRELFIAFGAGAYVLRYIFEDKKYAVIVRVWHSRENR